MTIDANFDAVQKIAIRAQLLSDGVPTGYSDELVFTAPADFPANTPAQILSLLGLTSAQVKQRFITRYQMWRATQDVQPLPPAPIQQVKDDLEAYLDQLDPATRRTQIETLQARLAAKLAAL